MKIWTYFLGSMFGAIAIFIFAWQLKHINKNSVPKSQNHIVNSNENALKNHNMSVASNDIYQYTDKNGNIVLTNRPNHPDAKKMQLPPLAVYATPMTKDDLYSSGYTSFMDNKGVSLNNQSVYIGGNKSNMDALPNINNDGRRLILSEELQHEENALQDSINLLNEAKKSKLVGETNTQYSERLSVLNDNITVHQKNIELLNQSLK